MLEFECMLGAMKLKQSVGHDGRDPVPENGFHAPEGRLEKISRDSKEQFVEPLVEKIDPKTGQVTYERKHNSKYNT